MSPCPARARTTAKYAKPRSNRPIGSGLGGLLPRLWRVEKLGEEELDALVEEATIDAYGDEEQLSGFAVMIEDKLEMPFETTILGRHGNRQRRHPDGSGHRGRLCPRRPPPGDPYP
jgi:hypothetical protein